MGRRRAPGLPRELTVLEYPRSIGKCRVSTANMGVASELWPPAPAFATA
jgi:hypothetical protein